MTPETEKLEDALKVQEQCGTAWHDMADAFYEKYNEHASAVIEQAARRYAEVLPLFESLMKQKNRWNKSLISDLKYISGMNIRIEKISAIVARGE